MLLLALAACGAPATTGPLPGAPAAASAGLAGASGISPDGARRRVYALSLEGARIGYTFEEEREAPLPAGSGAPAGDRGVELRRREVVRFRRGPELVTIETELLLAGTALGGASRVTVEVRHCVTDPARVAPPASWQITAAPLCPADPAPLAVRGPLGYRGSAERTPTGWQITDDTGTRTAPVEAQPAEWIDLSGPRDAGAGASAIDGAGELAPAAPSTLFFPARRFALGRATHHWIDERTWTGEVELDGAVLEATTSLGADGRPLITLDNTGAIAARTTGDETSYDLPVVDLVALTTVSIEGAPPPAGAPPRFQVVWRRAASASPPPTALPQPPAAPGQRVLAEPTGWRVELLAQPPSSPAAPDEPAAITAIAELAHLLAGDEPHAGGAAAGRDCTARALRFAAEARRRGWATRLVTGFLLDGGDLIRHRWAVVWTGVRWLAVDPSSGDAPAPPDLFALAVHDATAEALAGAEAAFAPMRGAVVRWLP